MDLVTLDGSRQAAKMVENYDSLIWTERYNTIGDFQITTGDVDRFMTLLPEGTIVSLRESAVPMIVETHLIERKKNTPTKLTIKGREFTSILDRRISVSAVTGTTEWVTTKKTPQDVAYYLIDAICVGGVLHANDIFSNTLVTFAFADYLTSTGPNRSFAIPRGNLLSTALQFIQAEAKADPGTSPATPVVVPHGIRAVRPGLTATAIQIQIYKGVDRTGTVYFDGTRELLDDGSYLFSKVGSASTALLQGPVNASIIEKGVAAATGLDRRVILVDGSNSALSDAQMLENGKMSLAEAKQTAMFDGSINQDLSPYVYNVDYGLGDIVKLVGDYGLTSSARVTEYIRSEDNTGVKSYPTLVTIEN